MPMKKHKPEQIVSLLRQIDNPIMYTDPRGLWAGGIGGSLAGIIGTPSIAGSGEGSCTVVVDGQGNVGLLCCLAFGGGTVIPAGGAISPQGGGLLCPNCKTICDMEGGFGTGQGFAAMGEGVAASVAVSIGLRTLTIGISIGPAAGGGGGAAGIGGSCKLIVGGKKCHSCPDNKH